MFSLPWRPPVDYRLEELIGNPLSSTEFTPDAFPRVTQPTIGVFSSPIFSDDVAPAKSEQKTNPLIVNKWLKDARAAWVDRPEENADFIHKMVHDYSVVVDPDYNPEFKHRPKLFPRSYKFELDCLEEKRIGLLLAKMKIEHEKKAEALKKYNESQNKKVKPIFEPKPCKLPPPDWWRIEEKAEKPKNKPGRSRSVPQKEESYPRWQKMPDLMKTDINDPCIRRSELALVGQPFKHEAINFYFANYPPPKIKFRPEKFSY